MSESTYPLEALLGATLSRRFTLRDLETSLPVNLTGWAPSIIIAKTRGGTTLHEINAANGLTVYGAPGDGVVDLAHWVPASGYTLGLGAYHYRFRLVGGATSVWALWSGSYTVAGQ